MLKFEPGELGFYQSLREMNRNFLEFELFRVYSRHKYQIKTGILGSEIGESGFYRSQREMNLMLFRFRDI